MLDQRTARFARLVGLAVLFLCLAGADCNDSIVEEILPGGSDECPPGNPTVVLDMDPEPDWLVLGGDLEVTVRIDQACDVAGVSFKLRTAPEHLRYESGVMGPFMGSEGGNTSFIAGEDSQQPGVVNVGIAVLGAGSDGELTPDGSGVFCTLRFEVLPAVLAAGETSIVPFNTTVFQPGLIELPVVFQPLTMTRFDR